jgi:hypothetical protein
VVSQLRPTLPGRPVPLRRLDLVVVSLLCLLLPPAFRDRQRGEWTGDLMALADHDPRGRGRYLLGAARTLPSLRRLARRNRAAGDVGPGAAEELRLTMPALARVTIARVLLFGLTWPMVSFAGWVALRYYAFDIAGQIRDSGGPVDPQSVWPMEGTPSWLLAVWLIPHFGSWSAIAGGPLLLLPVAVIGGMVAAVRHRHTATLGAAIGLFVGAAFLVGFVITIVVGLQDRGSAAALLGLVGVGLAATTPRLRTRNRVALLALSLASLGLAVASFGGPGHLMIDWFID